MGAPGPARLTWWQTAGYAACVGREREQRFFDAVLDDLHAGVGRFVLIAGEPGIGKSTLVGDVAGRAAAHGALVLTGACDDLTVNSPYAPWLAIWRAFPTGEPELPSPPSFATDGVAKAGLASQAELFERLSRFLRAVTALSPLVLIVEDIHWADPASVELLRHVARMVASEPLLLVATYRAEAVTPHDPLFKLLPKLIRQARVERIDLLPFTDDEAQALVARSYAMAQADEVRLVTYLQQRGDGNPFFLGELLRTLEAERLLVRKAAGWEVGDLRHAPVPALVRQVIEARLSGLDGNARALLDIAAVIGQEAPLDLWQAASGASPDRHAIAIQIAVDAHVLRETLNTTTIVFRHVLVRDTLYRRLSLTRRRELHRRIAELLATRPDPLYGSVAVHFELADDPRAVTNFVRAGEQALSVYAADHAISVLTRAQALAARYTLDLPLSAYQTRAAAYAMQGDFERARADYETVLDRARRNGNRLAEWQALIDLGLHWAERDYQRSGDYCRAALDLARVLDDHSLIAHSLNRVANWHANQDEPLIAVPLHQEALALFEAGNDQAGIADTLDHLGMASFLSCDLDLSVQYGERAIPLLRALGNRQRLSGTLAMLACCGGSGGVFDMATTGVVYREGAYWRGCADEALTLAREIGWPAGEAFALFCLSVVTAVQGDLGDALQQVVAGLSIAERIGHRQWAVGTRATLGMIWAECGDPQRGATTLEQTLAQAQQMGSSFMLTTTTVTLARVRITTGDLAAAEAALELAIHADYPRRTTGDRLAWLARAELALARGDPRRCLDLLDHLVAAGPVSASEDRLPIVQTLRGDACACLRRWDDAENLYRAARDTATVLGLRLVRWRNEAALARLYHVQGRAADALAAARSARQTIGGIASTIDDEVLRAQFLTAALAHLPADLATGQRHLSPRELDVLRLIADGKTDRDIGAHLAISPRTVMRHVTGILTKLGVETRTAAATLALRQHII